MNHPLVVGLLLLPLLLAPQSGSQLQAQAPDVPGPAASSLTIPFTFRAQHTQERLRLPSDQRRDANWKSAIIVGAVAGVVYGLTVATQDGDEGSDRALRDRVSDGLVAGVILAVPVTVIFAMLSGD